MPKGKAKAEKSAYTLSYLFQKSVCHMYVNNPGNFFIERTAGLSITTAPMGRGGGQTLPHAGCLTNRTHTCQETRLHMSAERRPRRRCRPWITRWWQRRKQVFLVPSVFTTPPPPHERWQPLRRTFAEVHHDLRLVCKRSPHALAHEGAVCLLAWGVCW